MPIHESFNNLCVYSWPESLLKSQLHKSLWYSFLGPEILLVCVSPDKITTKRIFNISVKGTFFGFSFAVAIQFNKPCWLQSFVCSQRPRYGLSLAKWCLSELWQFNAEPEKSIFLNCVCLCSSSWKAKSNRLELCIAFRWNVLSKSPQSGNSSSHHARERFSFWFWFFFLDFFFFGYLWHLKCATQHEINFPSFFTSIRRSINIQSVHDFDGACVYLCTMWISIDWLETSRFAYFNNSCFVVAIACFKCRRLLLSSG